jgi:primosomal protein N''
MHLLRGIAVAIAIWLAFWWGHYFGASTCRTTWSVNTTQDARFVEHMKSERDETILRQNLESLHAQLDSETQLAQRMNDSQAYFLSYPLLAPVEQVRLYRTRHSVRDQSK